MDNFSIEPKENQVIIPKSDKKPKTDFTLFVFSNIFDDLCGLKIRGIELLKKTNIPLLNICDKTWRVEASNGLIIYIYVQNSVLYISYDERDINAKYNLRPGAICNSLKVSIEDICAFFKWNFDMKEYYEWQT